MPALRVTDTMATHFQRDNGSPRTSHQILPFRPFNEGQTSFAPRVVQRGSMCSANLVVFLTQEGSIAGFPESILIRELIPSTIHTTIQAVGKGRDGGLRRAGSKVQSRVPTGSCKGRRGGVSLVVGPSSQSEGERIRERHQPPPS